MTVPSSANPIKWSNTLKHFVVLALNVLTTQPVNYCRKKAQSMMFDRALNLPQSQVVVSFSK